MLMEKDKNTLIWALIAVVIVLFLIGGFGMGGYGMMGFGMGFGFIFMLLFWGLIIWFIISLISASQSNKNDGSDSLTILKKRYAQGKITKKEFESMKKDLEE